MIPGTSRSSGVVVEVMTETAAMFSGWKQCFCLTGYEQCQMFEISPPDNRKSFNISVFSIITMMTLCSICQQTYWLVQDRRRFVVFLNFFTGLFELNFNIFRDIIPFHWLRPRCGHDSQFC